MTLIKEMKCLITFRISTVDKMCKIDWRLEKNCFTAL